MPTLKTCSDCAHKVSSKAASCPGCSKPNPGGVSATHLAVQVLVVIAGLLIVLGNVFNALNSSSNLSNQFTELEESSRAAKEAFKN